MSVKSAWTGGAAFQKSRYKLAQIRPVNGFGSVIGNSYPSAIQVSLVISHRVPGSKVSVVRFVRLPALVSPSPSMKKVRSPR
jgi:hypothetical protein